MKAQVLTEQAGALSRVCFISDTHLTSEDFESNSIFPNRLKKLSKDDAIRLYSEIKEEVHCSYSETIEQMKSGSWDMIVHLGDVTGGYDERGSLHDSVKELAKKCMEDLRKISKNVRVCVGNHDIGYESGLPYVTIENFRACEEIFGDLFWREDAGDFSIIGLCSSLAAYEAKDFKILELKQRQKEFLKKELDNGRRIVICIHDVYSLRNFSSEIMPNLHKIEKIVFGDLHHPSSHTIARRTFRVFNPMPTKENFAMMQCLKKSICCPSSAPLWWNGGSFLECEIGSGIKMSAKSTNKKSNSPTASFLKCYYWGKIY